MNQHAFSFGVVVKKPSALLPLSMSVAALGAARGRIHFGLATGHGGIIRETDEGLVAHSWQLLMAGQLPVLAFFAIKWLPRAPKQTASYSQFKPPPCWQPWRPCFCCTYNSVETFS